MSNLRLETADFILSQLDKAGLETFCDSCRLEYAIFDAGWTKFSDFQDFKDLFSFSEENAFEVSLKYSKEIAGIISLGVISPSELTDGSGVEISFLISEGIRTKRQISEILERAVSFCFLDLHQPKVVFRVFSDDSKSCGAIEHIGFRYLGIESIPVSVFGKSGRAATYIQSREMFRNKIKKEEELEEEPVEQMRLF